MTDASGGVAALLAANAAAANAEYIQLLRRLQSSKDAAMGDTIAALDARLRVIEARLGIESPVAAASTDPVAALESGAIEVDGAEGEEDGPGGLRFTYWRTGWI